MFRLCDEGYPGYVATTMWRTTKGTVNMFRTPRRSTALLAVGVLALGGVTAACESDDDNDDDVELDIDEDEIEDDLDDVGEDIEDGVDEIDEEIDEMDDDG